MALLKTKEDIKRYLGNASNSLEFDDVLPTIEVVEQDVLIREFLGNTLYQSLHTAYKDNAINEPANAHLKALLPFAQRFVSYSAMLSYMSELIVTMQSSGIVVTKTDRQESAKMWQVNKLEERYLASSFSAGEALFNFLFENKENYLSWVDSDQFIELTDTMIQSAEEFNRYYFIGRSRMVFSRVKSSLVECQDKYILPAIGTEYLEELIEKTRDNDMDPADTKAAVLIRKALANYTIANSLTQQLIHLGVNGVTVREFRASEHTARQESAPAEKRLQALIDHCTNSGSDYVSQLLKLLNGNPLDYPTFADSNAYTPENPAGDLMPTQNPDHGFFRTH